MYQISDRHFEQVPELLEHIVELYARSPRYRENIRAYRARQILGVFRRKKPIEKSSIQ